MSRVALPAYFRRMGFQLLERVGGGEGGGREGAIIRAVARIPGTDITQSPFYSRISWYYHRLHVAPSDYTVNTAAGALFPFFCRCRAFLSFLSWYVTMINLHYRESRVGEFHVNSCEEVIIIHVQRMLLSIALQIHLSKVNPPTKGCDKHESKKINKLKKKKIPKKYLYRIFVKYSLIRISRFIQQSAFIVR